MIRVSRLGQLALALLVIVAGSARVPAADLLFVTMGSSIVTYDTTGNVGSTIAGTKSTYASSNLNDSWGLAFDTSGNVYAANFNTNTISKFNASGGYLSSISTNLNSPYGLAFDASGNLYAASSGDNAVSKFNAAGVYQATIGSGTNLDSPVGLVFDASGNLIVSNGIYSTSGRPLVNTISKFNASGAYLSNINTNLSSPFGLAFDSSGNLYAANFDNSTISKYNASGAYLGSISSNLNSPVGLAFDSSGNLYASNYGNKTISKFDASGNFLTSWSTGTTAPRFLAFKPVAVPEPSTYALAAIASGVMAAVARRRKARRVQAS